MKNVRLLLLISCSVICIAAFIFFKYYFGRPLLSKEVAITAEEISSPSFLNNIQAIFYMSTAANEDIDGNGFSYAVFIDENGGARALQMEGLELGTVTAEEKGTVFLEEKNKVRLLGEGYTEFPMKQDEYTGLFSGYLEEKNLFFSIYNTGYKTGSNDYRSNVRYGNKKGFQTDVIPNYIAASGLINDNVVVLTQHTETGEYYLKKVTFPEKIEINNITKVLIEADLSPISSITGDGNNYYLLLFKYMDDFNGEVQLLTIDQKTNEQKISSFIRYKELKEDIVSIIPYNVKNSTYIQGEELFYVDGVGSVFTYNFVTGEINKKFELQHVSKTKVRHYEETAFTKDQLHIFYHNTKKEGYYLDRYNLHTGKIEKSQQIKNIDKIIKNTGKTVFSYDLEILQ